MTKSEGNGAKYTGKHGNSSNGIATRPAPDAGGYVELSGTALRNIADKIPDGYMELYNAGKGIFLQHNGDIYWKNGSAPVKLSGRQSRRNALGEEMN